MTMTVYAVHENGRWVLENALPRKTSGWPRASVGQINFFHEPGLVFDPAKARRAAAFIDSLASAFDLSRPAPLDYYVTSSVDEALNILGLQFPVKYGPNGAFSKPVNHQVFNGMPTIGEEHRHELAHVVMAPLLVGSPTILATEGVATWLGGIEGVDFRGSVRHLAGYLAAHPKITLDSILESGSIPQFVKYSGGAVLSEMLAESGGTPALKEFLTAGPGTAELRAALVHLLHQPWAAIMSAWRTSIDRLLPT
ncbi:MAG TPA: hypothetical protein VHE78_10385 [Gemmatimonadaceae bacterium]|nr:hypothetical protein [Gemmatimonadaceae bacterium]